MLTTRPTDAQIEDALNEAIATLDHATPDPVQVKLVSLRLRIMAAALAELK